MNVSSYRPHLATMKVIENTPEKLVLYYHPVTFIVLPAIFLVLCIWVAIRQASQGSWSDVALVLGFGTIFMAGFGGIFYRKVRLTLDRTTGTITHAKTVFFRDSVKTYPLDDLEGATVDTTYQGDTVMYRAVLQFHSIDPVPVTRAYMSGPNGTEVYEAIMAWHTQPALDSNP